MSGVDLHDLGELDYSQRHNYDSWSIQGSYFRAERWHIKFHKCDRRGHGIVYLFGEQFCREHNGFSHAERDCHGEQHFHLFYNRYSGDDGAICAGTHNG